ncbi:DTW domain-containing protein [Stutzerimonas nosocomialis]|uniref:tRNA-uridine aminocarboxypropyltransferase n=1 Tax=Stutzerimonas nosocomialis TaxID=1056496 RepID=UPI00110938FE|nr:DTW domain-containing protein [Stutzerimonas nosocomialis]TLX57176.1 DTW domain-containing protein [Stutzerimonas nosocomialis]TLX58182.1 DTW domain-containing protein [Stutzerimonas nosocomialis]
MPRPTCARCQRPLAHCLCVLIPSVPSRTAVLILQHPSEAGHALNTARLAALGLQRAELWVGERFEALADVLDAHGAGARLLFPGEGAQTLVEPWPQPAQTSLLVVPDGTWRKARKLLYLNPPLTELPRVALPQGMQSRYRVRKAPAEGALSTVEAIVHALSVLDAPLRFDALLRPFEALIEGQIQAMGRETYERNHATRDDSST